MEVFHAERFSCHSEFLFQASGTTFISEEEQKSSKPPLDYVISLQEDIHVGKIVQEIIVSDAFSTGKWGFELQTLEMFIRPNCTLQ